MHHVTDPEGLAEGRSQAVEGDQAAAGFQIGLGAAGIQVHQSRGSEIGSLGPEPGGRVHLDNGASAELDQERGDDPSPLLLANRTQADHVALLDQFLQAHAFQAFLPNDPANGGIGPTDRIVRAQFQQAIADAVEELAVALVNGGFAALQLPPGSTSLKDLARKLQAAEAGSAQVGDLVLQARARARPKEERNLQARLGRPGQDVGVPTQGRRNQHQVCPDAFQEAQGRAGPGSMQDTPPTGCQELSQRAPAPGACVNQQGLKARSRQVAGSSRPGGTVLSHARPLKTGPGPRKGRSLSWWGKVDQSRLEIKIAWTRGSSLPLNPTIRPTR